MNASAGLLRLREGDDVLIATRPLAAREVIDVESAALVVLADVPLGFKVAAADMPAGHVVSRYGMPIGVLTQDVAVGELVHVHNLTSRYLATHGRGEQ